MKKTIFSLIAALLLILLTLTSCTTVNEEASTAATQSFINSYDTALTLYQAVYGEGFKAEDTFKDDGDLYAQYSPVNDENCPYQSVEEMQTAIEKYFSEELAATICRIAFGAVYADGSSDGGNLSEDAPSIAARYRDNNGKLEVNLAHTARSAAEESLKPSFTTLKTVSSSASRVVLKVEMSPRDQSDDRSMEVEFTLLRQTGGWKFDHSPYVSKTALELQ